MKLEKKTGYHHGNLRQSIIHAVALIAQKKRSLDFQLKEIADLVGTSQPAIYKHFTGKKELLTEVAVAGYQIQTEFREKALKKISSNPLARIMAIARSYIKFAQHYPGYFLLIKSLETKEMLSSKRYLSMRKKTIHIVRTTVKDCIDKGYFEPIDLSVAVAALNSAIYGLVHLYTNGQLKILTKSINQKEEVVNQVLDLYYKSVLSESGRLAYKELKNVKTQILV